MQPELLLTSVASETCLSETIMNRIACLKSSTNIGDHSIITKFIKIRTIIRNQHAILSVSNCHWTFGNKIPVDDLLIFSKRVENIDFLTNRGFDWFYRSRGSEHCLPL